MSSLIHNLLVPNIQYIAARELDVQPVAAMYEVSYSQVV